jgi:hypothetical protein
MASASSRAKRVAPPCDGCRTQGASSARPATRPTVTTRRPAASCSANRTPVWTSSALGLRFAVSLPGWVGTAFQSSTSRSSPSSPRTRWTIVAVASAGPVPVSCRSDVNGTPETRAPRYPGASPTRRIGAPAREARYAARRARRSSALGPAAYWLNVRPMRARANSPTRSYATPLSMDTCPRWSSCVAASS